MPRRTHPRCRRTHSRAHAREQRDRYIAKRWQLGKRLYGDDFLLSRDLSVPGLVSDELYELRHVLRQVGPMVLVHPEVAARAPAWIRPWPFSLEPGRFARNPYTRCSCLLCTWSKRMEPRRAREKRRWQREAFEDLE